MAYLAIAGISFLMTVVSVLIAYAIFAINESLYHRGIRKDYEKLGILPVIALAFALSACSGNSSTGLVLDNQHQQIVNAQHQVAQTTTLADCKKTCDTKLAEIKASNEAAQATLKDSLKQEYKNGWNAGVVWGIIITIGIVIVAYVIGKKIRDIKK